MVDHLLRPAKIRYRRPVGPEPGPELLSGGAGPCLPSSDTMSGNHYPTLLAPASVTLTIPSVPTDGSQFLNISSVFHPGNERPLRSTKVKHLSSCNARKTGHGSLYLPMNSTERLSDHSSDVSSTCSR